MVVKIREILKKQHRTLLTSDLKILNIPRIYLSILEQNGEIDRVSRSVNQATNSIEDEMFSFQARDKSLIFSHETALYLHDLTNRTPIYYSISVPVRYHSINLKKRGINIFM